MEMFEILRCSISDIKSDTGEIKTILNNYILNHLVEIRRHYDILIKAMQKEKEDISDIEMCLDSLMYAIEKNKEEKVKSLLQKFGEFSAKALLNNAVKSAVISAIGVGTPLLPELVQNILQSFGC
jgi:predicted AAA+ superfamily ATPase